MILAKDYKIRRRLIKSEAPNRLAEETSVSEATRRRRASYCGVNRKGKMEEEGEDQIKGERRSSSTGWHCGHDMYSCTCRAAINGRWMTGTAMGLNADVAAAVRHLSVRDLFWVKMMIRCDALADPQGQCRYFGPARPSASSFPAPWDCRCLTVLGHGTLASFRGCHMRRRRVSGRN